MISTFQPIIQQIVYIEAASGYWAGLLLAKLGRSLSAKTTATDVNRVKTQAIHPRT